MKTFNKETKQKYIDRVIKLREQGGISQGPHDSNCLASLAGADENAPVVLQDEAGIPVWLSLAAANIHFYMDSVLHSTWPERFISAIPENTTQEAIEKEFKAPFLLLLLNTALENLDHDAHPPVKAALDAAITVWERKDIGSEDWATALRACYRMTVRHNVDMGEEDWCLAERAQECVYDSSHYPYTSKEEAMNDMEQYVPFLGEVYTDAQRDEDAVRHASNDAAVAKSGIAEAISDAASCAGWNAYHKVQENVPYNDAVEAASSAASTTMQLAKYKFFSEELIRLLENCTQETQSE